MARSNGGPEGAWICGLGMVTSVGDCAAQTASSVRAGICRYEESAVYNRRFRPMTLALLPEDALSPLAEELQPASLTARQIRMLRLATTAMAEALAPLPEGRKVPLFLAAPEPLPERPAVVDAGFLDQLLVQTASAGRIDRARSALFPTGRAGGLEALAAALDSLDEDQVSFALVGGLETFLDLYLLATLDVESRVLADGVMNGFAPGEGAGFLLLGSERAREAASTPLRVRVGRPGLAEEAGHRFSEEPYRGDGLADAVGAALATSDALPVATVLSSLNGENFGAKEWGVASLRHAGELGDVHTMEHPADCFGDVGAAFAPILIGLGAIGMSKGYLPGPCLVYCSSELAPRGAVIVSMQPSEE